jgi:ABC-type microcin C transport system permease subunit YejB
MYITSAGAALGNLRRETASISRQDGSLTLFACACIILVAFATVSFGSFIIVLFAGGNFFL